MDFVQVPDTPVPPGLKNGTAGKGKPDSFKGIYNVRLKFSPKDREVLTGTSALTYREPGLGRPFVGRFSLRASDEGFAGHFRNYDEESNILGSR